MDKRKLSPNELRLVAYQDDLNADDQPEQLHIARVLVSKMWLSKSACGKGEEYVFPYPFQRWLLHNAPICATCKRETAAMIEGEYEDWFGPQPPSSNTGVNS